MSGPSYNKMPEKEGYNEDSEEKVGCVKYYFGDAEDIRKIILLVSIIALSVGLACFLGTISLWSGDSSTSHNATDTVADSSVANSTAAVIKALLRGASNMNNTGASPGQ